jgi:hypothetical protein
MDVRDLVDRETFDEASLPVFEVSLAGSLARRFFSEWVTEEATDQTIPSLERMSSGMLAVLLLPLWLLPVLFLRYIGAEAAGPSYSF